MSGIFVMDVVSTHTKHRVLLPKRPAFPGGADATSVLDMDLAGGTG